MSLATGRFVAVNPATRTALSGREGNFAQAAVTADGLIFRAEVK